MIHTDTRPTRGSTGAVTAAAVATVALLLAACGGGGSALTPSSSPTGSSASPTPTTSTTPTSTTPAVAGHATLTGLPMASLAAIDRPIVVIDVGFPAGHAAPSGIAQADVVYQEFDRPGRSRLVAVYQSQDAGTVGPVVDTSPIDWRVTSVMGLPVLAFASGSTGFVKQVGPTVVTPRSSDTYPSLFRHSGGALYTSTTALRASAPGAAVAPKGLIGFGDSAAESKAGRKVTHLTVTVPGQPAQSWTFNGQLWVGPGGVTATNVVVQNVPYKTLTPNHAPPVGSALIIGSGSGTVVAGGVSVAVSWFRLQLTSITNYVDVHAFPVTLLPGRSWVIFAPPGSKAVTS